MTLKRQNLTDEQVQDIKTQLRELLLKNGDDYIYDSSLYIFQEIVELLIDCKIPTEQMKFYINYLEKQDKGLIITNENRY